jgi:cytochrome b
MKTAVRVWDLPTRSFHWSLVLLMIFSFVTAKVGGNWMRWHFLSGYAILSLISFRVLWGFFGGRYARFRSFLFSPMQILQYVRGAPNAVKTLGHNPMGSLSVFALIGFVGLQATTGLFSNDDISEEGPLVRFISNATSNWFTSIHHLNEKVLIVLVVTHIAAVLFYLLRKRENLIVPMLSGDKLAEPNFSSSESAPLNALASRDDRRSRALALILLGLCAAIVAVIVNWPAKT